MKKSSLATLILVGLVGLILKDAKAGAAVALGPNNEIFTSGGHPREVAKENALAMARRKCGANVRIIASTDLTGYCAVAAARHPNGYGWIIGVALGRRSATEADTLAVEQCLKAGGTKPRVRSGFRG